MAHSPDQSGPSLWVESPEVRVGTVARVAMKAAVDGEYSFSVPDDLAGQTAPGKRVMVPFGKSAKPRLAFCVSVAEEAWTNTLRPVAEVLDEAPLLNEHLMELGRWMSRYYCCPLGRTLFAMVPEPVRRQSGFRTVRILRLAETPEAAAAPPRPLSSHRKRVIETLASVPDGLAYDELMSRCDVSQAVLNSMIKASLVTVQTQRKAAPAPDFDEPGDEPTFDLNDTQRAAITRIGEQSARGQFRAILLFGVSGSGKTEVYIHSIRAVLAQDCQAIMLVPEIALTTQLVHRLASRFHDVAVIHSGLSDAQRSLTHAAIARGEKRVVIGTRSAVFAPCPRLGLIVVDEEQEGSFKNQQSPRFHTRDVAIKRAQLTSIPIVLGSATPSLETWHNCDRLEHFERITLPSRIAGLPMPAVEFVDMRIEQRQRNGLHLLSLRMEEQLRETLTARQQAVLLLNRRGYASYLVCSVCRNPVVCPNCGINMVLHQTTGQVKCHYCSARFLLPKRCGNPACGGTLTRFGMGTQRVEEELRTKFPDAQVARADSDAMTRTSDYERIVRDFAERRIDFLVGTQMVAKGLDFPGVSLVGVVNADTSMSIPDFRAAERTFQLITQVAGRAGRAEAGGRVVVQSLGGRTAALDFAADHDYESFAGQELALRQRVGWPPFSRLARILITHRSPAKGRHLAHELADTVRQHFANHALAGDVLGPQSAPLPRLRNLYRFDFLIRAASAGRLLALLDHLRGAKVLTPNTAHALIDVDPVSLL